MSEPVGNSPRRDIPGNSHKERAQAVPPTDPEREKVEQIISGGAKTRKKPWYQRWVSSIVAEDIPSIKDFVLVDVIQPTVRNLIRDAVVGATDQALYGRGRARTATPGAVLGARPGQGGSTIRTMYNGMSEGPGRPVLSRESRARHDFEQIVFETRDDGIRVLQAMDDLVAKFGVVRVSDLHDLAGVTGDFASQNWGWRDIARADVRPVRHGFVLDLPAPEPIR